MKTLRLLFAAYLLSSWLFITPALAEEPITPEPEVTVIVTQGGDDVSYLVPLTTTVVYDNVTYDKVYATTNSVITFGNPDGTYWTYPNTPSVSIESRDWWALPQQMPDTHFIISVSQGGFQVDGAYRPFGTMTGEVTSIVITAQITLTGAVEYSYNVQGPLYGGERTGARLNDGTIVTLEEAGINEVAAPVELAPEPVTPTEPVVVPPVVPVEPPVITPEIVIPYIPPQIIVIDTNLEPLPTTEEPMPEPPTEEPLTDEESVLVDEPLTEENLEQPTQESEQESQLEEPIDTPIDNLDEPTSETVESQEPVTQADVDNLVESLSTDGEVTQAEIELIAEALVEASEGEPISAETITEAGLTYEDLPPSTPVEVREDSNGNPVVITAEVAAALVVLESPVELLNTIFSDPAQALLAISSIGADMSDEERAESEQTIVAAVIVSGIAVQSAASAAIAGSASYRRRM